MGWMSGNHRMLGPGNSRTFNMNIHRLHSMESRQTPLFSNTCNSFPQCTTHDQLLAERNALLIWSQYLLVGLVDVKWKLENTIDVTPLSIDAAGRTWKLACIPLPSCMVWLLNINTRWSEDRRLLYAVRRFLDTWILVNEMDISKPNVECTRDLVTLHLDIIYL